MSKRNQLMASIQYFFQSYLPTERGLSQHTIKSYRDTLKLLLNHLAKLKKKRITGIDLDELTAENILSFLSSIEKNRKNCVSTRNQRLAVLKTFTSFLLARDLARSSQYEKIAMIKSKKEPYQPIVYLTNEEVDSILNCVDLNSAQGVRDYAILTTLYNTGARVQEICDIRPKDVRFERPYMITVTGKGKKTRSVPLWEGTVLAIKKYLSQSPKSDDTQIFIGKRSEPLSRHAIRYLVQNYVKKASSKCTSLKGKEIGPHTFRHTTAMHLLQSGVDISVIKEWLGHADLNTTHGYVEINLKMKEEALNKAVKPKTKDTINSILKQEPDIIKWLEAI